MRRLRSFGSALPLALLGRAAAGQTPAAPEFIVNTVTVNVQAMPSLSMDARGNFVVVWQSALQDGGSYGVFGQRFDAAGARAGAEFRANASTPGSQALADVAVDRNGDFVVAWADSASGPEIEGRRFDRSGVPLASDFQVNSYLTGTQTYPAVAADAVGNFVVVWESGGQDGSGLGVFARRFDVGGNALGSDFRVNSYLTGDQGSPDVAFTADGGFVVVFDGPDSVANGVHARRFNAAGAPVGADFSLTTTAAAQFEPAVAARPQGGFVVVWTSYGQDASHNGIFGRIFDATGTPVTGEIAVNTYTTNAQSFPAVAADGLGNFVVIWESVLEDGSDAGVFGQRFDATGARRGAEFQLNTFTAGAQIDVGVAADSAGNFVGAWGSANQDGNGSAVVGRRFQGLLPVALAVDTLGNGVLEPNESARLEPSWRNATTATQSFQGTLANFTGPAPGIYTISDATANYGTTLAGQVHSCSNGTNCYALMAAAAPRPALHWDTAVVESLTGPPAAQGVQKSWVMHVGDSFSDVPRSHSFYRFVETLLHHRVTGGCTGSRYCPADATTRDGMAVFVLVAREGAGYVPAPCGTPMFNDVPAGNPFCRWVEELARRGVVNGCGGGSYCPASPVARQEMPIFVLRTLDPTLNPPACTTPMFNDVPASSPFCRWIEELARRGVVTGCGGGSYCPTAPVTRGEMGVFISVTFGLTLYGP